MQGKTDSLVKRYSKAISDISQSVGLTKEEMTSIVYTLVMNTLYNDFFKPHLVPQQGNPEFIHIIEYLAQNGLTPEQIRETLVEDPQILLFCEHIEDVYLIFQRDNFCSFVLVDGNDYRAYKKGDYSLSRALVQDVRILQDFPHLLEALVDVFSTNHQINTLLDSAERSDIAEFYDIKDNDSVKEILTKMSRVPSDSNNYHVKSAGQKQEKLQNKRI